MAAMENYNLNPRGFLPHFPLVSPARFPDASLNCCGPILVALERAIRDASLEGRKKAERGPNGRLIYINSQPGRGRYSVQVLNFGLISIVLSVERFEPPDLPVREGFSY
jgi:hypothetical protein